MTRHFASEDIYHPSKTKDKSSYATVMHREREREREKEKRRERKRERERERENKCFVSEMIPLFYYLHSRSSKEGYALTKAN